MKKLIYVLLALVLFSCGAQPQNNEAPVVEDTAAVVKDTIVAAEPEGGSGGDRDRENIK